jgi:hypothetical protein
MHRKQPWPATVAAALLLASGVRAADEPESAKPAGSEQGLGPSASKVYGIERGVSFGGYGEWLYQNFDTSLDDGTPSGAIDNADNLRLVMYAGYKYSDKILFNSEIEYEHASTGEEGEVSVEFAYLDFLFRPSLNVRTGLVLVPVGFLNEIHEPPTFLGARRPLVERVVLPATWRELGAGVWGTAGPLTYRGYLTTSLDASGFTASDGIRGGRQDGSEALAEDLALSGRLDYTGTPGLIAGVSFFTGDTGQGADVLGSTLDAGVTTLDAHVDWRWRALQVRGLWAQVTVDDADEVATLTGETVGEQIDGAYVEAGYDVLAHTRFSRQQLIPFARWERFDTQAEVPDALAPTVTGENDRELLTVGLVYLPIPQVAVKADFQNLDNDADTGLDQFNIGVGFAF